MQNLIKLKKDEVFTDSLVIANGTNNEHNSIQLMITKYGSDFKELGKLRFEMRPLKSGQRTKLYLLNEEQATFLMTLLKNSMQVVQFKKELVKQFYEMKKLLLEKQSLEWQSTRQQSKLTRKNETDIIKELVEYAKEQGSNHSDKLYVTYSRLANKIAGIKNRDIANTMQLNTLLTAENIIYRGVVEGMNKGLHYKDIYQDCKRKLELFRSIAYIEPSTSNKLIEVK